MAHLCSTPDCENGRRENQRYCRACHAAYMRNQRAQGKNKRKNGEIDKVKNKARRLVNYAVGKGEITLPDHCETCQTTENLEKHHPDYSKPLEVVVLCRLCHAQLHALEARQAKQAS